MTERQEGMEITNSPTVCRRSSIKAMLAQTCVGVDASPWHRIGARIAVDPRVSRQKRNHGNATTSVTRQSPPCGLLYVSQAQIHAESTTIWIDWEENSLTEVTCIQSCHVCVKWTELTENTFMFQSIRLTTDSLIWQYLLKGGLWRYLIQM
jgi:hypothetical protein